MHLGWRAVLGAFPLSRWAQLTGAGVAGDWSFLCALSPLRVAKLPVNVAREKVKAAFLEGTVLEVRGKMKTEAVQAQFLQGPEESWSSMGGGQGGAGLGSQAGGPALRLGRGWGPGMQPLECPLESVPGDTSLREGLMRPAAWPEPRALQKGSCQPCFSFPG